MRAARKVKFAHRRIRRDAFRRFSEGLSGLSHETSQAVFMDQGRALIERALSDALAAEFIRSGLTERVLKASGNPRMLRRILGRARADEWAGGVTLPVR